MEIVETARQQSEWMNPPFKDKLHREYFEILSVSTDYQLKKIGPNDAEVVFYSPGENSYLQVKMHQFSQGAWAVGKTQMVIDPKVLAREQNDGKLTE